MKSFADWYDEYSYWAEIDEAGLPQQIAKDAWGARDEQIKELKRENKSLKIRLDMYDADATTLIEEHGCDPEDKIDREVLKRMLNYLIGENRRLKNEHQIN